MQSKLTQLIQSVHKRRALMSPCFEVASKLETLRYLLLALDRIDVRSND